MKALIFIESDDCCISDIEEIATVEFAQCNHLTVIDIDHVDCVCDNYYSVAHSVPTTVLDKIADYVQRLAKRNLDGPNISKQFLQSDPLSLSGYNAVPSARRYLQRLESAAQLWPRWSDFEDVVRKEKESK